MSRLTLCNPTDCSMPGLPVLHCLLELAQALQLCFCWFSRMILPYFFMGFALFLIVGFLLLLLSLFYSELLIFHRPFNYLRAGLKMNPSREGLCLLLLVPINSGPPSRKFSSSGLFGTTPVVRTWTTNHVKLAYEGSAQQQGQYRRALLYPFTQEALLAPWLHPGSS